MSADFLTGFGWRDIVLAAVAVIGIYLVLSVMRLVQVGRRPRGSAPKPADIGLDLDLTAQKSAAPVVAEPDFASELARSNIEVELERMRRESALLRQELDHLTGEVARLKATRNVSPQYNEAMALAQQGMSAAGIAGRCGISIGEAELVAAMARGGNDFQRH